MPIGYGFADETHFIARDLRYVEGDFGRHLGQNISSYESGEKPSIIFSICSVRALDVPMLPSFVNSRLSLSKAIVMSPFSALFRLLFYGKIEVVNR